MIAIDEPELTPQQSEAVRRLLAGARHDEPMPAEVVDRLDAVLADLKAESAGSADVSQAPASTSPVDNVTPLRAATERSSSEPPRRSKLPQLFLAAAAVAAIGFGVTQILPTGEGDGDSGAGDTSFSSDQAPDAGSSDADREEGAPSMGAQPPTDAEKDQQYSAPARERQLLDRVELPGLAPLPQGELAARRTTLDGCGPESLDQGQRKVPATYQGDPAVVVFVAHEDGTRTAELYLCDAADPQEVATSAPLAAP